MRKVAIPLVILLGESRLRLLGVEVRLGLADRRLLQRLFALEAVEGRLTRLNDCGRAVDGGAKIAIVETNQRLPRAHIFVVPNEDLRDETGHVRRYRGDIAPGIGVVGAFNEPSDAPPLMTVPGPGERGEPAKRHVRQPFEPHSCQRAGWRLPNVFAGDGAHRCLLCSHRFCRGPKKSVYAPIEPTN